MRCIEMIISLKRFLCLKRLTLTWDVLKYKHTHFTHLSHKGLTLTWDVLKYPKIVNSKDYDDD